MAEVAVPCPKCRVFFSLPDIGPMDLNVEEALTCPRCRHVVGSEPGDQVEVRVAGVRDQVADGWVREIANRLRPGESSD